MLPPGDSSLPTSIPSRPEPTRFRTICSFCGLHLSYIPAIHSYFLNHWEVSLYYPIAVLFVIHSSYLEFLLFIYPFETFVNCPLFLYLTLTNFLFSFSYIAAILVGPGYLPWCYPERAPAEALAWVVTSDEQRVIAKSARYPIRTGFFKSARRAVIRADHFCAWLACFVGKKNHKLFFLFNFWGVMYIGVYLGCCIATLWGLLSDFNEEEWSRIAANGIYTMLAMSFLLLTGSFLVQNVRQIHENRTQFEIMLGLPIGQYRTSPWWRNWEQIFGSVEKWYWWLIPRQAFPGIDEYSLAERYMFSVPPRRQGGGI
jgi:hypothetical protein